MTGRAVSKRRMGMPALDPATGLLMWRVALELANGEARMKIVPWAAETTWLTEKQAEQGQVRIVAGFVRDGLSNVEQIVVPSRYALMNV